MDFKEIRKSVNMSQSQFSKYFDIPLSTLQDWEHGRRTPPIYVYKMIIKILQIENKA